MKKVKIFLLVIVIIKISSLVLKAQTTQGQIGYWTFNGNTNDLVGNNNGTNNGAILTADRFGTSNSAYNFGAGNINIGLPNKYTFSNSSFTIGYWLYLTSDGSRGGFMQMNRYSPYAGIYIGKMNSGEICAFIKDNNETILSVYITQNLHAWIKYDITYNNATKTLVLYKNGISVGQSSNENFNNNFDESSSHAPIIMCQYLDYEHGYAKGKFDDLRIYNRALNASEILEIYNAESPGIPLVPTLSSPTNGETVSRFNPELIWTSSGPAPFTSYRLQISSSSTFNPADVVDYSTTSTTYNANSGLNYNTIYYWRVNATNGSGTSTWSNVWSFTTPAAPPSTPTLSFPTEGRTVSSLIPTFSWNYSFGAQYWGLEISTDPSFNNKVLDLEGLQMPTYDATQPLNNSTTYYWRVNATNGSGTSIWSSVESFTISVATLSAPILSSPTSGTVIASLTPLLIWNTSSGATSYGIQVSTSSSFVTAVVNVSSITTTTFNITSGLSNGTTYYWRVNATNGSGTSGWSESWNFSTPVAYEFSTLSSPIEGGTTTQSGSGTYNSGDSVTVIATPASGYTFINWTEEGTQVSTDSIYTFTITSDRTLTSNFVLASTQYVVTILPTEEGGTAEQSGSGAYYVKDSVTVTAIPDSGYIFNGWLSNGEEVPEVESNYKFVVISNCSIMPRFIPPIVINDWLTCGTNDIYTAGNVGINTQNPNSKLTVKGKIHTEVLIVDADIIPDYVFEEDHILKSLNEVESYIRANKHLPGIPSAKEVKEKGMRLGEMHSKLLEKIEELTLYLIELKKEQEETKREFEKLTK